MFATAMIMIALAAMIFFGICIVGFVQDLRTGKIAQLNQPLDSHNEKQANAQSQARPERRAA